MAEIEILLYVSFAIVLAATGTLIWRINQSRAVSIWAVLLLVNPLLTLLKGLTIVRCYTVGLGIWFSLKKITIYLPYWVILPLLIAAWSALTIIWSPDKQIAISTTLDLLIVGVFLLATISVGDKFKTASNMAKIASPIIIFSSIATILFRFFPNFEATYFRSELAKILHGSQTIEKILRGTVEANVLLGDGMKSGGIFFTNANRASLFFGLVVITYLIVYISEKRTYALIVALSSGAAILSTNSKTGIFLFLLFSVGVVISSLFVLKLPSRKRAKYFSWLAFATGVFFLILAKSNLIAMFLSASAETLKPRAYIWETAINSIKQNLFLGLGQGGWKLAWTPVANRIQISEEYPPHNFMLETWLSMGIVGALLVLFFLVLCVTQLFIWLRQSLTNSDRLIRILAIVMWLWIVVHGLGDNTLYYGCLNCLPLVAITMMISSGNLDWLGSSKFSLTTRPIRFLVSRNRVQVHQSSSYVRKEFS